MPKVASNDVRLRIHQRIRKRLSGVTARPRLAVFRSNKHIYAQVIDDSKGTTLVAVSTLDADAKKDVKRGGNIAAAKTVGKLVAERAKAKGISAVLFDRGGYLYHGRVKTLAEAAREAGLKVLWWITKRILGNHRRLKATGVWLNLLRKILKGGKTRGSAVWWGLGAEGGEF